ncbi:hypothetical protein MR772_10820 [bacterium]|nr:hypothetical protein [bacterium]
MATIVEMINPLTGLPEQVDKLDHTAQEIDNAVDLAPQLSNPNLLDNWYFAYPVNQRNVSGTIDAVGYFLDRWKLVSGSVTIGSNGITLNGTIAQILETAVGTDVTASALTTEGVVVASYDNNSKTISLTGTGQTFVAAKLELCSTQTLAHQENGVWVLNEIPNYGEQLARCKRYFWRSWTGERNVQKSILGVVFGNNHRITGFDYPVEMRTKPSITVYGLTGAGKVTEFASDADYGPASPGYWDTQRCMALKCDGAGLSNDNRVYYFIEANAEL